MCLAIYKPASTRPDWEAYRNGHSSNKDSWGFAAVVDGQLVTLCGIGDFAEFREAFEPYADRQAIIHFRWSTHGKTDLDNCHPFLVHDDLAVIHNGIISIKCDVDADRSDTWHFNELVLRPMHRRDPDFFTRSDVRFTQELAHESSKFCFIRADGEYAIWNESAGKWDADGHWYSNNSHQSSYGRYIGFSRSTATYTKPYTTPSHTRGWDMDDDCWWRKKEEQEVEASYEEATVEIAEREGMSEEEREEEAFCNMRLEELREYGFTNSCLQEVLEMLGYDAIEALHDLI